MSAPVRPTSYAGWASGPSGYCAEPIAADKAQGFLPTGIARSSYINWLLNANYQWQVYLDLSRGLGLLGDGSDAGVTLDGSFAAPAWATKSGTVYTLTRDIFLDSNGLLVTGAGTRLFTAGYRIYCQGTVSTASGGAIDAFPGTPTGMTGFSVSAGTLAAGGAGVNGATNGAGTTGTFVTGSLGGNGGAGGAGNGVAGGGGGVATQLSAAQGNPPRGYSPGTFGVSVSRTGVVSITGGAGGGSAGGDVAGGSGGGGGAGGGVVAIAARTIMLASAADVSARGGGGGNSLVGAGANAGGAGGGGGGVVLLAFMGITAATGTLSAAVCCPGGPPGTKGSGGAGSAGATGSVGTVIQIPIT